jgi:mutator protein MutT
VSDDQRIVVVLAGVIEREGRFLLTRRLKNTHLAGYWEFPGGKCETNENLDACLIRELREELGVSAVVGDEILMTEHAYPDRTVRIHFRRCDIDGDPSPQLGQEMRWIARHELATLQLPPADDELIALLVNRRDR